MIVSVREAGVNHYITLHYLCILLAFYSPPLLVYCVSMVTLQRNFLRSDVADICNSFKDIFKQNTDICILFEISAIRSRYLNIFADISNLISDRYLKLITGIFILQKMELVVGTSYFRYNVTHFICN